MRANIYLVDELAPLRRPFLAKDSDGNRECLMALVGTEVSRSAFGMCSSPSSGRGGSRGRKRVGEEGEEEVEER